ncbi:hypothetical protein H1W37_07150 [Stappia taiwanensis]|uniref:Uncharacterized protein n=1 Tax=Stappia taiwanensis TaxID=992267 RepID=A0A838XXA2_9HYPH|nr:hypothetical protein [Stappia taiwanensis]MBA4611420.1 hypothetical protein [Stappia taiwanensis]
MGGTKENSGVAFAVFPRPPIADDALPDYQRAKDGAKPLPNRWRAEFSRSARPKNGQINILISLTFQKEALHRIPPCKLPDPVSET